MRYDKDHSLKSVDMGARREAVNSYRTAIDQLISVVHRCHLICLAWAKMGYFLNY